MKGIRGRDPFSGLVDFGFVGWVGNGIKEEWKGRIGS